MGYGRFNNGAVEYSQAGLINGLLLTVHLLIFGLLVCVLYVRLLRSTGPTLALLTERLRAWLAPLLFVLSLGLLLGVAITGLFSLALYALTSAVVGAALWWER